MPASVAYPGNQSEYAQNNHRDHVPFRRHRATMVAQAGKERPMSQLNARNLQPYEQEVIGSLREILKLLREIAKQMPDPRQ
jgi:hypothetical protein